MNFIGISSEYGIVIREAALGQRDVERPRILNALETDMPFNRGEGLIAFGPHFGQEAADEFIGRLEALGLKYVDDFFILVPEAPSWFRFGGAFSG